MKTLRLFSLLLVLSACVNAQTVIGIGQSPSANLAQKLSDCPSVQTGYFLCPLFDGTNQPSLAFSVAGYQNGQPFVMLSQGPPGTAGAPGPPGPQGPPGNIQVPATAVGTGTATANFQCPAGNGTIGNGFNTPKSGTCTITFQNLTFKIVTIQ